MTTDEGDEQEQHAMRVKRLPHDGRMIMGGKGVIIPFRPEKKPDDVPTPLDDPEPLMKGARDAYERQAMELAADPPLSMREIAERKNRETP